MAINNPYLPIKVITNGVLDTFAFNWSLTQAQDIKVYFEDSRGVKTLVDTGDYTLQRNTGENGGNIIFNTPPTTGQTLIIEREEEKTQEKEFSNTKTFNLKYFQDALDKLTRWCQEQDYGIGQAIKIPETAVSDEEDPIDIWNRIILSDTGESIKYAKIENGNLYVKSSTGSWIMMPKSSNIRQVRQRVEYIDSQPIYIFEYTLNGTDWFGMADTSLYKQHKNLEGRDEADQHPASAITGVAEHIADTDNPHATTADQVGAYTKGETDDLLDNKADLSGATFTGDISATNLSGTNTGDQDLSSYAIDDEVVHLAGTETITGVKTFNASPIVPTPTTDYEVATKKYVDDNAGGGGGSGSSLSAGQILFGLYEELPSAAYVWGDAGKQELNNASTNYSNLVDNITGGLIPSDTIAAWDAAYAANPDNAVPFWGYDSATDKVIVPNIPRGYAMTAAGSLANVGTVLQNAAPNITGTLSRVSSALLTNYPSGTGAFVRTSAYTEASKVGGSGNPPLLANFGLDASLSNAAYGRDSTTRVRNDQIQMRVLFYVGAEVSPQEASQITAANVLSELHSKLDKPSTWSNDDFAAFRKQITSLNWADKVEFTTYPYTAPNDGVLFVNKKSGQSWTINGIIINNGGNDSTNYEGPSQIPVSKGDTISALADGGIMTFVPFYGQAGTNNLILGINYYGKFATLSDLNTASASLIETPLGKGRWALVGNDIDGYVRYYTAPTDGSFSEFTWEEGAPDTTDGDYVVETGGTSAAWYRLYKSGWVEQGGYNQNNTTPTTVTLPIPMADTYYTATANSRQNGYTSNFNIASRNMAMNWSATICEQTTTTLSIRGSITEDNYTGYNWRVEGMAA